MTLWFPIEPLSKKMAAKSQPSYFFNLSNLASQLILATFPRTTGSRTIISWGRRSQSWTLEEKMGRVFPASHQFQTRSASTQTFLGSRLYQKETLLQKNMKHQFSAVMVQNELLYHHNWGFSSGSWSSGLSKLIKSASYPEVPMIKPSSSQPFFASLMNRFMSRCLCKILIPRERPKQIQATGVFTGFPI